MNSFFFVCFRETACYRLLAYRHGTHRKFSIIPSYFKIEILAIVIIVTDMQSLSKKTNHTCRAVQLTWRF